jgi:hypothetical protein
LFNESVMNSELGLMFKYRLKTDKICVSAL